jgi:membrane protease YdiL (CAAX protease family)
LHRHPAPRQLGRPISIGPIGQRLTKPGHRLESLLDESMRAHTLRFEAPLAPKHADAVGIRMLVAFLVVGVGLFLALRFLAAAAGIRGSPAANLGFVVALLAAFVATQLLFVRAPLTAVGLRQLADWTRRERLFLLQVVPLVVVVFSIVFRTHLLALIAKHGLAEFLLFSLLTGILWGIVQELLYRGWLQTELTRRFGAVAGLLLANAVFTFGPLHLNYLLDPAGVRWGALAAVFGIGLFFGLVYARSGNVWIPAILHGLWPPNMS